MSTKCFCDRCKCEVSNTGRLIRKLGRFQAEVISCVDNVWNGGHLCQECVKDIIIKGKRAKTVLT